MKNKKRTIAIFPFNEKRHTVFNSFILELKKKYNIIYNPMIKEKSKVIIMISRIPFIKYLYYKFIKSYFSILDFKNIFKNKERKPSEDYDLILASNSIPDFPCSYILDLEIVNALGGYDSRRMDKEKIKESLSSDNCKAIVCWYEISKDSLVNTIDCSSFKEKIKVIPFGFPSHKFKIARNKDETVKLLFVSSVNNPQDFEQKGGIIAIESYLKLVNSFPDITLTVRSYVPKWVKKKYKNIRGLTFIEKFLSEEEMKELFLSSDIILEPTPGLQLLLEAMDYSIPVICFNAWMIDELVQDSITGFTIDSSKIFGSKDNIEKYVEDFNINYIKFFNRNPDKELVDKFAEKASILIKNQKMREKMGRNAKLLLSEKGRYNFDKMIKEYITLIEQSIKNK